MTGRPSADDPGYWEGGAAGTAVVELGGGPSLGFSGRVWVYRAGADSGYEEAGESAAGGAFCGAAGAAASP